MSMGERKEFPLRSVIIAGAAFGFATASPETAHAEDPLGDINAGMSEYLEATRSRVGDDTNYWTQERRTQRLKLEDDFETGLGRYVQENIFDQTFDIELPGELSFSTEDVRGERIRGDGARVIFTFRIQPPRP